jgi:hypothetical protein
VANYARMMESVMVDKDSSSGEIVSAFNALMALHSLQSVNFTEAYQVRQSTILGGEDIGKIIDLGYARMEIEDCLKSIGFLLGKVETCKGKVSIEQVFDICFSVINQAYKLKNMAERIHVLVLAFKRLVEANIEYLEGGSE